MVRFSEPYGVDELLYEDDVIMNIDDINHRFIESITYSQIIMEYAPTLISKVVNKKIKKVHFNLPLMDPGPIKEIDIQPRKKFVSNNWHSNLNPKDLSERWNIIIAQTALKFKASTRRLI